MDKQELNKKLAEWAVFICYWEEGATDSLWRYPEEPETQMRKDCPDFTQSLDACFKWLVPKARTKFGVTKMDFCYIGEEIGCRLFGGYGALLELSKSGLVRTEALALCLAIEKLIDGGGDKTVVI